MSDNGESPGIGGYPDLTKPQTRVTQVWRHVVTVLYKDIPDGARRSAKARARMKGKR